MLSSVTARTDIDAISSTLAGMAGGSAIVVRGAYGWRGATSRHPFGAGDTSWWHKGFCAHEKRPLIRERFLSIGNFHRSIDDSWKTLSIPSGYDFSDKPAFFVCTPQLVMFSMIFLVCHGCDCSGSDVASISPTIFEEHLMNRIFRRIAIPLALAAALGFASAATNAGTLTFQGVTFTTSFTGNLLTLEIDAANPTGDWATATTLGALGIKDVGTFDSVALTSAPAGAATWTINNMELSANGCATGGNAQTLCAFGSHVLLANDMVFQFTFTGGTQDFTSPHLKVAFYTGDGDQKVGSLLSQNIPAVPEPATYGMLLAGLGLVGALARGRRG
jgi:hypothetical protein